MAKEKIAYDPFGFSKEETNEKVPEATKGLNDDFTRHTIVMRLEYLNKLRCYGYWERLSQRDLMDEILAAYFKDKKIKELPKK